MGLIAVVLGFGGFIAWAAWAPLDEGVPVQAQVTIETKRKTVQHMTGGVVQRVLVREGQQVKAGDVLVELDASASRANFEAVRQNYMGQRAMESRLQAEIENKPAISFHADLLASSEDSQVSQHMQTQRQLFDARRGAFQNEIKALHENIAAMKAQVAGIDRQIENRKQQAEKLAEQLSSLSDLAREGYAPRNQVLQLEQSQSELRSIIADLQGNRQRIDRSIDRY
jgi:protease secretion system membrane fusion protein